MPVGLLTLSMGTLVGTHLLCTCDDVGRHEGRPGLHRAEGEKAVSQSVNSNKPVRADHLLQWVTGYNGKRAATLSSSE